MKKHLRTIATHSIMSIVMVLPFVVGAQCEDGQLCNPLGTDSIWELFETLINDILVGIIAPIVVTLGLLWSGFNFITAQGNESKLAKARTQFLYVLVGSVILLGAAVILELVVGTVNELTN